MIELLVFTTSWSNKSDEVDQTLADISVLFPKEILTIRKIDAEKENESSIKYNVEAVPTFILLKEGKVVGRVNGNLHEKIIAAIEASFSNSNSRSLEDRLKTLINSDKFMIFIKGTPQTPKCGFTMQLLTLLKDHNVHYSYFDILSDEEVRQGLKKYSKWPTYPQVYHNGELLGGLDIIQEMVATGEFQSLQQNKQ